MLLNCKTADIWAICDENIDIAFAKRCMPLRLTISHLTDLSKDMKVGWG